MAISQRPTVTQLSMFAEVPMTATEKKIRNQLDGLFGRHTELTQRIKKLEEVVEHLQSKVQSTENPRTNIQQAKSA
jgi:hypothetical protein